MEKLRVRLFLDETSASERAVELMDSAGVEYESMRASGHNVPGVEWGDYMYAGIQGVRQFLSLYRSEEEMRVIFDRHQVELERRLAELDRRYTPATGEVLDTFIDI